MPDVLLSTAYLPPVDWAALWLQHSVRVDEKERFEKQSYRNRAEILGPNGVQDLIIPVEKPSGSPARSWRMAFREDWPTKHWKALETAYDNSPFFYAFKEELKVVYQSPGEELLEFNRRLWNICAGLLELPLPGGAEAQGEVRDLRNIIHPKKPSPVREFPVYLQPWRHRHGFVPRLSVLDLLCAEGPAARGYLEQLSFVF